MLAMGTRGQGQSHRFGKVPPPQRRYKRGPSAAIGVWAYLRASRSRRTIRNQPILESAMSVRNRRGRISFFPDPPSGGQSYRRFGCCTHAMGHPKTCFIEPQRRTQRFQSSFLNLRPQCGQKSSSGSRSVPHSGQVFSTSNLRIVLLPMLDASLLPAICFNSMLGRGRL